MLADTMLRDKENIIVEPQELEIPLEEDSAFPFSLMLPSAEELERIHALSFDMIALKDTVKSAELMEKNSLNRVREQMLQRFDRFKDSPVYLSRLASISRRNGELASAVHFDNEAARISANGKGFKNRRPLEFLMGVTPDLVKMPQTIEHIEKDADVLFSKSTIAIANKQLTEAYQWAEKALEYAPGQSDVMARVAILALLHGDTSRAIRLFRLVVNAQPNSSSFLLHLAIAYTLQGDRRSALATLRKVVAINPIDRTAVIAYCDLLSLQGKHSDVIAILKVYQQYDQRQTAILDRLARAYFAIERFREALTSFELRAALQADSDAWSNIGVVHWRLKNNKKATQFFIKAINLAAEEGCQNWRPTCNLLSLLMSEKRYEEMLSITSEVLAQLNITDLARTPVAALILAKHVLALSETGKEDEAIQLTKQLLSDQKSDSQLRFQLMFYATYYYSLLHLAPDIANHYAKLAQYELECITDVPIKDRALLLNNIIFSLLESGDIARAEQLIPKLSRFFHVEATPTATLGLLHFKKGHVERGEELYREAVRLTNDQQLVARLKQKVNLELAKSYATGGDFDRARDSLKRVVREPRGLLAISEQASQFLRGLPSSSTNI